MAVNDYEMIFEILLDDDEEILWSGRPFVRERPFIDNLMKHPMKLYGFTFFLSLVLVSAIISITFLISFLFLGYTLNLSVLFPGIIYVIFSFTILFYLNLFDLPARRETEKRRRKLIKTSYYTTRKRLISIETVYPTLFGILTKKPKSYLLEQTFLENIKNYTFTLLNHLSPALWKFVFRTNYLDDKESKFSFLKAQFIEDQYPPKENPVVISVKRSFFPRGNLLHRNYYNLTEAQMKDISKLLEHILPDKLEECPT